MIAYLILAFKNPHQVARLVLRLKAKNSLVYIHVDRKVNILPFMTACDQPYVKFLRQRHNIVWGGYSITAALITGMAEILSHKNVSHIALMSGQDYPVKSVQELTNMLAKTPGYSFLNVEENTPSSKWWQVATSRYKFYYMSDYNIKGKRILNQIIRRILPEREFIYPHYTLYGGAGATFGILTNDAAHYIVTFMNGNRKAHRFAKTTFASDEFWFQTILMNSELRHKVINRSLWYMKWNEISKHPNILTFADYSTITYSDCFFARKFDNTIDEHILNLLDQKIPFKNFPQTNIVSSENMNTSEAFIPDLDLSRPRAAKIG